MDFWFYISFLWYVVSGSIKIMTLIYAQLFNHVLLLMHYLQEVRVSLASVHSAGKSWNIVPVSALGKRLLQCRLWRSQWEEFKDVHVKTFFSVWNSNSAKWSSTKPIAQERGVVQCGVAALASSWAPHSCSLKPRDWGKSRDKEK